MCQGTIDRDWETQSGAARYELHYRVNNGSFTKIETVSSYAEILNSEAGTYEFRLFSFNGLNEPSRNPATLTFTAVGKTAPPPDITNLTYEPISDKEIRLRWDAVDAADVRAGGRIHIRHTPKTDGTGTFQDATDLVFALSGASTEKVVPLLEGEYILKTQDDGDRFSTGETSLVIDLPEAQPKLLVQTRREDQDSPAFQGSKTNVGFDVSSNTISLAGTGLFDSITNFDNVSSLDDLGGVSPSGTYLFNETLLEGEYILKTQDDGDRFSTGETSLVIDLPEAQPKLLVQTRREDQDSPAFQGSKTNVGFDVSSNTISLAGTGLFDSITNFDNVSSLDDLGGVSPSGTYLFNETLDLGGVFSLDLRKHLRSASVYSTDLFDSIVDLDARQDFDGTGSTDTNAEVFVQTSQDGSNYSGFQKFANGTFKGRTFKFKCVLTTKDTNQDIRISELGYTAEFQRRTEQSTTTIASGAGIVTGKHI